MPQLRIGQAMAGEWLKFFFLQPFPFTVDLSQQVIDQGQAWNKASYGGCLCCLRISNDVNDNDVRLGLQLLTLQRYPIDDFMFFYLLSFFCTCILTLYNKMTPVSLLVQNQSSKMLMVQLTWIQF